MPDDDKQPPATPAKTIPDAGPDPEPRFDEPAGPAPEVVDAPGRNTEL